MQKKFSHLHLKLTGPSRFEHLKHLLGSAAGLVSFLSSCILETAAVGLATSGEKTKGRAGAETCLDSRKHLEQRPSWQPKKVLHMRQIGASI